MKKISLIISGLKLGGAERVVADLAGGLKASGMDVFVVALSPGGIFTPMLRHQGVAVVEISTKNPFSVLAELVQLLNRERPDIVHTHLFYADLFGSIAAKIAGNIPVVSTLHNITFGGRFHEWILRMIRPLIAHHSAVAQIVRDYVQLHGIAKAADVIYNGIDRNYFKRIHSQAEARAMLGLNQGDVIFVSVGRLIDQKGFSNLIDAFDQMALKGSKLIILGEGNLRPALERRAGKRLGESVFLPGATDLVRDYLEAADMFVMSSLWEGFSLALVEAAAIGIPIVATRVGIAPELMGLEASECMVAPGDINALADAMRRLQETPLDVRRKRSDRLVGIVDQKFSRTAMIRAYTEIYDAISPNKR